MPLPNRGWAGPSSSFSLSGKQHNFFMFIRVYTAAIAALNSMRPI
jgi:hypothetical protein